MAWEAILSTDPQFDMVFDEVRQIENQITDEGLCLGLLWPVGPRGIDNLDYCIIFHNSESGSTYTVSCDGPIKPLSTVDSTDPNIIINLLESGCHSLSRPLLPNVNPVTESEVFITHQTMFINDEKDADLHELLCSFAITMDSRRSWTSWNGANSIYFDRPLPECYTWARNFENTLRAVVPNVQFKNRIGICNDCTNMLRREEHAVRDIAGWGIYLCDECYIQRKIQRKKEEDLKKEAAKQKREARKKGLPTLQTFTPKQIILPSEKLGRALYQLYGGKCQYCPFPEPLPKDKVVIEHIIPRAIPLDSIHTMLQQMGVSKAAAHHFCETLLPPYHDCVLNYTLSCVRHNTMKGGRLLNTASLEMALQKAKRKAEKLLVLYGCNFVLM